MATAVELLPKRTRTCAEGLVRKGSPLATGLLLILVDLVALAVAGWTGAVGWSFINPGVTPSPYFALWPALTVFLLVYASIGLYPAAGLSPVEELRRVVSATTLVYLAASASIFLSKDIGAYSRGVFLLSWLGSVFLVPLLRVALRHTFAARPWWGVPVIILGGGEVGHTVCSRLIGQPYLGLKPVALLADCDEEGHPHCEIPLAGSLSLAPELARSLGVRHALVAMPEVKRGELVAALDRMGEIFPHLIMIPDLFGMASLWVSPRDIGGVLGFEIRQNLLMPMNRWINRAFDLIFASLFGILAAPVIALAAILIKCVSPGRAFYTQERMGEGDRPIHVLKLRTMYVDAETRLTQLLARNPVARREWERYFKLKEDPRILPGIGRFLRRTSLDELPQLWNVICGEMSLVGPRPFPPYHLEHFNAKFRALRSRVTPGITGPWQVSARSNGDLFVQEALDSYYIRNWSLWLDLHILARTVHAVVSRDGAY